MHHARCHGNVRHVSLVFIAWLVLLISLQYSLLSLSDRGFRRPYCSFVVCSVMGVFPLCLLHGDWQGVVMNARISIGQSNPSNHTRLVWLHLQSLMTRSFALWLCWSLIVHESAYAKREIYVQIEVCIRTELKNGFGNSWW